MSNPTQEEIIITAVVGRIEANPYGNSTMLAEAFALAGNYVAEQARVIGEPWDAEAEFFYMGSRYTVRGTNA